MVGGRSPLTGAPFSTGVLAALDQLDEPGPEDAWNYLSDWQSIYDRLLPVRPMHEPAGEPTSTGAWYGFPSRGAAHDALAWALLTCCAPGDRQLLVAHYVDGLSLREIGLLLSDPPPHKFTVALRLKAALGTLREALEPWRSPSAAVAP